jgi:P4 family phage/plasmid primase-like protien
MELDKFLKKHYNKDNFNYTKIKNEKFNISGGTYGIPLDKINDFYNIYKKTVFIDKSQVYLTEKQLEEGPILIDLDFRYSPEVEERQHTKNDIMNLIEYIFDVLSIVKQITNEMIKCYIFEKKNVNTSLENVTKDGIHILINLKMDFNEKIILRNKLLMGISDILSSLPIINTWEDVIDDGVMKGINNWQLYGSRKPGNEPYELKYYLQAKYENNSWNLKENKFDNSYIYENFEDLTARNYNLVSMKMNETILNEYNMIKNNRTKKDTKNKIRLLTNISNEKKPYELSNENELDSYIEEMLDNLQLNEEYIKQSHLYTMILDDSFYRPGSYNMWIKVGMALKITSEKLFVSWVKLSSKSPDFDWSSIEQMYIMWSNFNNDEGLTIRSIIYWARDCNFIEYNKIRNKSIQKYIHYSFTNQTDYDIANVLYHAYKECFVCVNIKNNIWYEFDQNKWCEIDSGTNLRFKLSTDIFDFYEKHCEYIIKQQEKIVDTPDDKELEKLKKKYTTLSKKIKTSSEKSNIMKEAKEIFFDKDFYNKLDTNPYLIGCSNGIIDIKNKLFRKGTHDDYISLSTNITYKPLEEYKKSEPHVIKEINEFFEQLFPEEELRKYMWEHLASTLVGTNENQTFNIYTGSGANGKSKLVELMSKVLGDYKGTVPITLITQKRNNIGSTSSEVAQLIGKRYAVMQEPSKGDKINEGIMKEITGGDPIQCRALFKDSITYTPQFKLVVCTNTLFDITSNDDGTWRRIRVCEFKSKFTNNPYNDKQFPVEDYPYQFNIDYNIDSKFKYWAPVFFSMLVDISFKTLGRVKDTNCVIEPTNKYRERQDVLLEFCRANIEESKDEDVTFPKLQISVIKDVFKQWHINQYGNSKQPTGKEISEYFNKKYGKYPIKGWTNIKLKQEDDD